MNPIYSDFDDHKRGSLMAEIIVCMHCQKEINKAREEYKVTNKAVRFGKDGRENKWFYAHAGCQKKIDEKLKVGG